MFYSLRKWLRMALRHDGWDVNMVGTGQDGTDMKDNVCLRPLTELVCTDTPRRTTRLHPAFFCTRFAMLCKILSATGRILSSLMEVPTMLTATSRLTKRTNIWKALPTTSGILTAWRTPASLYQPFFQLPMTWAQGCVFRSTVHLGSL